MEKQLKAMPKLTSEDTERDFWASADSTDYVDWSKASRASFPALKPSLKTISLRELGSGARRPGGRRGCAVDRRS
jgi:hypothetical protein